MNRKPLPAGPGLFYCPFFFQNTIQLIILPVAADQLLSFFAKTITCINQKPGWPFLLA
jgi:hypothetical protein